MRRCWGKVFSDCFLPPVSRKEERYKRRYVFVQKLLGFLGCLLPFCVFSQDIQFTQYYNAPLLLNPAMTGNTRCMRAGLNARSQWTGLPGGAFNTASAYVDYNLADYRSGVGLLVLHDEIGTPRLTSNEVAAFYSFLAPVSKRVNFRFGLEGGFVSQNLNYSRLIFEDQFSGITVANSSTVDPVTNYNRVNFGDISAGVLLFGVDEYWLGFSADHLNQPDQSFYVPGSHLPIKYSLHGGYNFYLKRKIPGHKREDDSRIIPTFNYRGQDKFDQLDLGVYLVKSSFIIGFWYRGIPIKKSNGVVDQDAIDIQLGYQYKRISFTYSYDLTISKLALRNTKGSHEISLIYYYCFRRRGRKPPRNVRKLPCPDFQKSLRYDYDY